ncbi:hypothetical protein BT96DRAFT_1009972 [Gymnopus androsaceus JB14]|uniref:F-box domain-containing protein n=1 Tax=Gymnopus androsaceus JB14 TaxID=1447944 RepID=A0A6A4GBH3_9AGAR|nr:hypothetical protein BT96DRAFT_1009972 [Gymnopus androsaceus JB14]
MPFLTLPIDSFPVLAELDLLIFPHKSPHNQKVSAFASSPLQKLSFHCPYSGFFTQSASLGLNKFSFDAAQLTSLYVYDYLIHSLWDFLQGCQNLVQLTVIVRQTNFDSPLTVPVTLPLLEKLTVISCYEEILVRIDLFGFLTTPALTDLCIDLSESIYANRTALFSRVLIDFQKRCDCSLSTMSFFCADGLTNKDLSRLIEIYNFSLRSLTVIGKKIRPKTLLQKLLCKPKAKEALLPHLEFLRFSLDSGSGSSSDFKPSLLLDVVESRWLDENLARFNVNARLSKVQMDKIVERREMLQVHSFFDADLDSEDGDDVTSDELEKEEEESWLTSAMSKTDKKRLERLQSDGFQVLETTFFIKLDFP